MGLPYGEAVGVLGAQGIEVVDVKKQGNDLPLAECIVRGGEFDLGANEIVLRVNCSNDE